jgi:Mn2+/Fe2+ NRAMP family transporter
LVTKPFWKVLAWGIAALLTTLNVWLVYETVLGWVAP